MQSVAEYIEEIKPVATGHSQLRKSALEHFNRLGIPTSKNENWKHTNLPLFVTKENLFAESKTNAVDINALLKQFPFLQNSNYVILENGNFNDELTDISNFNKGIRVAKISSEENNPLVKEHFSKYVDFNNHSLAALNIAQMNTGIFIHVAANHQMRTPFYIINAASGENTVSHPHILLVVENNSKISVAFITVNQSINQKTIINPVHEIVVMENAHVEFDFIQLDGSEAIQVSHTYAYQKKNSVFDINTITLGGKMVRNNLNIMMDDERCESHLNGLYITDNKQHVDNQTSVYHAKPNCQSNELYKGILDDNSTGVFNGRIFVLKDAQKTNAYQSNKNVLLSDNANMYAKPQLEIFADDVKCSHGATTGQLDDDALFYLRSRGVGEQNAKALLNFAFASDVVEKINIEPLRHALLKNLAVKLNSQIEFETE